MTPRHEIPSDLRLSQAMLSDLTRWYAELEAGGDEPVAQTQEQLRILIARILAGLSETRSSTLMLLEGVLEALEREQVEVARVILREAVEFFRDAPQGDVN